MFCEIKPVRFDFDIDDEKATISSCKFLET
jgi:hypothetical protein